MENNFNSIKEIPNNKETFLTITNQQNNFEENLTNIEKIEKGSGVETDISEQVILALNELKDFMENFNENLTGITHKQQSTFVRSF